MAEIRFRALVCGPVGAAIVFVVLEESDGQAWFTDFEFSCPLEVRLEQASVEDLPEYCRPKGGPLRLFPVEIVSGSTDYEAFNRMRARLGELARGRPGREADPLR